jgi:hypothetical protein
MFGMGMPHGEPYWDYDWLGVQGARERTIIWEEPMAKSKRTWDEDREENESASEGMTTDKYETIIEHCLKMIQVQSRALEAMGAAYDALARHAGVPTIAESEPAEEETSEQS